MSEKPWKYTPHTPEILSAAEMVQRSLDRCRTLADEITAMFTNKAYDPQRYEDLRQQQRDAWIALEVQTGALVGTLLPTEDVIRRMEAAVNKYRSCSEAAS